MLSTKEIQDTVKQLFDSENFISDPAELYEPIQYTLALGGKRLRPTLLLAACDMFGGDVGKASAAAVGIEVFHNFTLLHDDLMDKSPLRRGKETVYRRWNENIAILSGDTMFALAYRYFLRQWHPNMEAILKTFTETAIGVCDGQQYDMNFETQADVSIADYMKMIELKTAILLAGAMKIGALYAEASEKDIDTLYRAGISIGLAFQLQDDLLDAYGDVSVFGKQTGTDIKDNKKTYLYLSALKKADKSQKETLQRLFKTTPENPDEKIRTVIGIYDSLNIKALVEKDIETYFEQSLRYLDGINLGNDSKETMKQIINQLLGRKI
ncbi:MAG: polyprenyl synthetase family protein [Bacteroidales bacterium]|nr:polyprenyl synthetase family protein [Bacteroidales bacterium]